LLTDRRSARREILGFSMTSLDKSTNQINPCNVKNSSVLESKKGVLLQQTLTMAAPMKVCRFCCNYISDNKSYRSLASETCKNQYDTVYQMLTIQPEGVVCNLCMNKLNRVSKLNHDIETKVFALQAERDKIISQIKDMQGFKGQSTTIHQMLVCTVKEEVEEEAAQAVAIPADQRILHILPQEYAIDNQEGVKEPLGMSGVRLEAKVHLVTCAVNASQNIEKCIRRCGLDVDDIILEQLASSYSILTEDEKELGVCIVDIGGGTTDIAIFTDGSIRHTAVIPIAGDQVTNDIAMALRTPTPFAEEIKIKHATALTSIVGGNDDKINVPGVGERQSRELSRQALAEVVEPRYDELFTLVQAELRRSGFEELIAAGVVLTGGTSKMEGVVELAEEIFHMPVRLGFPRCSRGMADVVNDPIYATVVGLLRYGLQTQIEGVAFGGNKQEDSWLTKVKRWFQGNF